MDIIMKINSKKTLLVLCFISMLQIGCKDRNIEEDIKNVQKISNPDIFLVGIYSKYQMMFMVLPLIKSFMREKVYIGFILTENL